MVLLFSVNKTLLREDKDCPELAGELAQHMHAVKLTLLFKYFAICLFGFFYTHFPYKKALNILFTFYQISTFKIE